MGHQDGARSLDCVNKLLQLRVGHVNETFTNALEVETGIVQSHHHQSPLYASMDGVAYSLTHTAIEGSKVAPKGTTRLDPRLGLESISDRPCSTLQGSVLPGLGI
jgi:4-aminobutyrate aminotransferase-like enzyme